MLADSLPQVFADSLSRSSSKGYAYGFLRWKKWALKYDEISIFSPKSFHVALYLIHVMQNANSPAVVELAKFSLAWGHKMAGLPDPTKDSCISCVIECAKRKLGGKKQKKEIVTADMLQECVKICDLSKLSDVRILAMCLLAFAGFLRFQELQSLRRCDFFFHEKYLKVFIESSKTDQYRDGQWIIIVKSGQDTCPYAMLKCYFLMAGISEDSQDHIFRAVITKRDKSQSLRSDRKPISYTRAREIFLDLFKRAGYQDINLGLHSLRAGGASGAANNGIQDRLFKRHGRWKSDSAKDGYVKDDLQALLSVSQSLGI